MRYKQLFNNFESGYIGYAGIGMLIQSGIGSLAVMLIAGRGHQLIHMLEMFCIVALCMSYNASVIIQFNRKIAFNLLLISLGVSLLFIAVNLSYYVVN